MTFTMKPLSCDPARIKGMSERLIISHYENNYGGATKRLNVIEEKLAQLDYANARGFLINGLKREQLIAMNSMVSCMRYFLMDLANKANPAGFYWTLSIETLVRMSAGAPNSLRWEKRSVGDPAGYCCHGRRVTANWSINGRLTTATRSPVVHRFSRSICTSIPITSILARRRPRMSTHSWRQLIGPLLEACMAGSGYDSSNVMCPRTGRRIALAGL